MRVINYDFIFFKFYVIFSQDFIIINDLYIIDFHLIFANAISLKKPKLFATFAIFF